MPSHEMALNEKKKTNKLSILLVHSYIPAGQVQFSFKGCLVYMFISI